jgi:hypothetical protein
MRLARALILSLTVGAHAFAADSGAYAPPVKSGINKDAMTMQECRDRLAAPAKERPSSDDPLINLDAMCRNMLGAEGRRKAGRAAAPSASAPSQAVK